MSFKDLPPDLIEAAKKVLQKKTPVDVKPAIPSGESDPSVNEARGPCWPKYEMIGMKNKNGRKVPNCVPVKEEQQIDEITRREMESWPAEGKPGQKSSLTFDKNKIKDASVDALKFAKGLHKTDPKTAALANKELERRKNLKEAEEEVKQANKKMIWKDKPITTYITPKPNPPKDNTYDGGPRWKDKPITTYVTPKPNPPKDNTYDGGPRWKDKPITTYITPKPKSMKDYAVMKKEEIEGIKEEDEKPKFKYKKPKSTLAKTVKDVVKKKEEPKEEPNGMDLLAGSSMQAKAHKAKFRNIVSGLKNPDLKQKMSSEIAKADSLEKISDVLVSYQKHVKDELKEEEINEFLLPLAIAAGEAIAAASPEVVAGLSATAAGGAIWGSQKLKNMKKTNEPYAPPPAVTPKTNSKPNAKDVVSRIKKSGGKAVPTQIAGSALDKLSKKQSSKTAFKPADIGTESGVGETPIPGVSVANASEQAKKAAQERAAAKADAGTKAAEKVDALSPTTALSALFSPSDKPPFESDALRALNTAAGMSPEAPYVKGRH